MYASILLALAATSAMAAPVKTAPPTYAVGYLEDYATYNTRYLALDCHKQHHTEFFQDCCRPLLATENLVDNRKAYCTPNATQSSSASEYEATATSVVDAGSADEWSTESAAAESTAPVADAKVAQAEATSTSEWVAPSTTEAPAAEETQASSGSPSGDVHTGGFATFFYQGGNAGACGEYNSDDAHIVAIDGNGWWQDFSQASDLCGRWVNIKNTKNGKTVSAKIADVCPTCVSDNSLDLSVGAFNAIATEAEGSVPIEWSFA